MLTNSNSNHTGTLFKYANVIKGYQNRHIEINSETLELNYYTIEKPEKIHLRKHKGKINLKNAVVLPSKDDNISFTIHTFDNNVHLVSYFKVNDNADREEWMNFLKSNSGTKVIENSVANDVNTDVPATPEIATNDNLTNACLICLDSLNEPVVTLCGHLFCKSCISQWINLKPNSQICPVCKTSINKKKLVRLYGLNEKGQTDDYEETENNDNLTQQESLAEENIQYHNRNSPPLRVHLFNLCARASQFVYNLESSINFNQNRSFGERLVNCFIAIYWAVVILIVLLLLLICVLFYFSPKLAIILIISICFLFLLAKKK